MINSVSLICLSTQKPAVVLIQSGISDSCADVVTESPIMRVDITILDIIMPRLAN